VGRGGRLAASLGSSGSANSWAKPRLPSPSRPRARATRPHSIKYVSGDTNAPAIRASHSDSTDISSTACRTRKRQKGRSGGGGGGTWRVPAKVAPRGASPVRKSMITSRIIIITTTTIAMQFGRVRGGILLAKGGFWINFNFWL